MAEKHKHIGYVQCLSGGKKTKAPEYMSGYYGDKYFGTCVIGICFWIINLAHIVYFRLGEINVN